MEVLSHTPILPYFLQWSNPYIPKANRFARISVSLQLNRRGTVFSIIRFADILGQSHYFIIILHEHSIKKNRYASGRIQASIFLEAGCGPYQFIVLPFTWFAGRIGQGDSLFINTSDLTINIGRVVIIIQYLQFISYIRTTIRNTGKENSAVTASLSRTGNIFRYPEFQVQLIIVKSLTGHDAFSLFINSHNMVVHFPSGSFGRIRAFSTPQIQV